VVVPALVGLFWGAPLVARDLEEGTFRLAWTQSVTRARWLAVKLTLVGLASMAVTGLFTLMVTWWYSPLDRLSGSPFASFGSRDLVPVGYAAFAFALGVTVGVLTRRTFPALAISLAAFVAVRLAITYWVRPGLFSPAHQDVALNPSTTGYGSEGLALFGLPPSTLQPATPNIPGAWITSVQIVNNSGQPLSTQFLNRTCPGIGGGGGGAGGGVGGGSAHSQAPASVTQRLQDCVATVGKSYHELVTYQPGSRYWLFQWSELAIYVGIAVVLAGFCVWRIRRHPA
jgi:ABC-2 family transporter protein